MPNRKFGPPNPENLQDPASGTRLSSSVFFSSSHHEHSLTPGREEVRPCWGSFQPLSSIREWRPSPQAPPWACLGSWWPLLLLSLRHASSLSQALGCVQGQQEESQSTDSASVSYLSWLTLPILSFLAKGSVNLAMPQRKPSGSWALPCFRLVRLRLDHVLPPLPHTWSRGGCPLGTASSPRCRCREWRRSFWFTYRPRAGLSPSFFTFILFISF